MTTATPRTLEAHERLARIQCPPRPITRAAIARRLLLCQLAGYLLLITISWLNELLDLPYRLFGGSPGHNWHEATIETCLIVVAALPTLLLTRSLARRLVYLEKFLRVCAWCQKIGVDDKWVSMEAYFKRELNTTTSHGMCPECFASVRGEIERSAGFAGESLINPHRL